MKYVLKNIIHTSKTSRSVNLHNTERSIADSIFLINAGHLTDITGLFLTKYENTLQEVEDKKIISASDEFISDNVIKKLFIIRRLK